jgi:hypothetical protein
MLLEIFTDDGVGTLVLPDTATTSHELMREQA